MCGIVGFAGNDSAIQKLKFGLKRLEYRGYDSAGVSFFCGKKLKTTKCVGSVDCLFEKLGNNFEKSHVGIGHTRWATHGKATKNNSHPHLSEHGIVSVVHNGIVENYQELKAEFLPSTKFLSDTDTEVVANLIEKELTKLQSNKKDYLQQKLNAIKNVMQTIKGTYALAILFFDDTTRVFFAKQTSPLLIGLGKNGNYISSDILGFDADATQFVEVLDGQFGWIDDKNLQIFDKNGKIVHFAPKKIQNVQNDAKLCGFSHYMQKEIFEIPKSIDTTCELYLSKNSPFEKLRFENIKRIFLIACGTSFHASKVAEIWLRQLGFDATAEVASEFVCSPHNLNKNTLCIFASQSGETADTITATKLAKKHHAKTVCITNVGTSSLAKLCDNVLPLVCGPEIAVASTKAYNTELCVLKLLCWFLDNKKRQLKQNKLNIKYGKNIKNWQKNRQNWQKNTKKLKKLSQKIDFQNFSNQVKSLCKSVVCAKKIFMVGKNFDYVLALESALKLKEITYLNAEAYPSGELKHGTISLIDTDTLVFAFATEKKLASKTMNIVEQVHSRGAKVVLISPFEEYASNKCVFNFLKLPKICKEFYPIVSIIPMQLLAYDVSVALGNNPDKPRNLAKSVTVE